MLDDERGGRFALGPARADARVVSRRYHARSLVLETVWQVGGARLVVDDALDLARVHFWYAACAPKAMPSTCALTSTRRRGRVRERR